MINPFPLAVLRKSAYSLTFRGKGLVKTLLNSVHQDAIERGDAFSILFGRTHVYQSSGYQPTGNLHMEVQPNQWASISDAMVRSLNITWPQQVVHLVGYPF